MHCIVLHGGDVQDLRFVFSKLRGRYVVLNTTAEACDHARINIDIYAAHVCEILV